jgi:hypothetical protein
MKHQASGADQLLAWNNSQDVAHAAAHAFCERFSFQCFTERVKSLQATPKVLQVLEALGVIFVLNIWEHDPWFYTSGFLQSAPASPEEVREKTRHAYKVVRGHASDLVDAFGIPLKDLGVIAGDWISAAAF